MLLYILLALQVVALLGWCLAAPTASTPCLIPSSRSAKSSAIFIAFAKPQRREISDGLINSKSQKDPLRVYRAGEGTGEVNGAK
jgi:hypothetical protein